MAEPLVSVVIPAHAGERFLADAAQSVARQTYSSTETIVVDDGSPDGTAALAARLPGVTLIRQSQQGVAAARNAGARAARGELLAFLDQDDVWMPEKLARQVGTLRTRPEVDLVLCHIETVLMGGLNRPYWLDPSLLTEPSRGLIPSTWLVRREAFDRVGPFDPRFTIACDADWLARFKDLGGISVMLAEALVRWRIHEANGSHAQAPMQQETLAMIRGTVRRQRQATGGSDA